MKKPTAAMSLDAKWSTPTPVDDVTLAFPANIVATLMPAMRDIPRDYPNADKWQTLTSHWFFQGLKGTLVPKEGIDLTTAMRHIKAVLGSYEPKHEHKEAAVAYLMSRWFDRFEATP